jgi:DNA-binding LytR/AlgR family response regulator
MNRQALRSVDPWQLPAGELESKPRLDVVVPAPTPGTAGVWLAGAPSRVAARRRGSIVVLELADVWAFEARERLCFVHSAGGTFDVDLSLHQLATELGPAFVRPHRRWIASVANVREYRTHGGSHALLVGRLGATAPHNSIEVPVSREYAMQIRARLLEGTVGFRSRRRPE